MGKHFYKERINNCLCSITALILFLLIPAMSLQAQNRILSGTVTSAVDGEPLIGVSVLIKGTTTGVITDFDGRYSINVSDGSTLVFSDKMLVEKQHSLALLAP